MKKRHSIATRIFGLFVLLSLLSGGVVLSNSVSFQHLANRSQSLIDEQLPILVSAAKVAQIGGVITTDATNLALAKSEEALHRAQDSLTNSLPKLALLADSSAVSRRSTEFSLLLQRLSENIESIYRNTETKLKIQAIQRQRRQQLHWLQIDFVEEVTPLTTESQYNMNLLLEKLAQQQTLSEREFRVLRLASNAQSQLLKLEADVNLVLDLLQRVSLFSDKNDILTAQSVIDETLLEVNRQILSLASLPSTVTIRQIAEQVDELTSGPGNAIAQSLEVLTLDKKNQLLLSENQAFIGNVRLIIKDAVSFAEQQNADTAEELGRVIENSGRQLNYTLIGIVILTLIVGGYLRNQVLNRLSHVLRSMRHLANGELQPPIAISGKDEVSSLANATNIFNEQAQQVRDNTRMLEEKNQQLTDEILQRKQAEQTLKDTQEELVQAAKLAVLGQLTSGIVHEFSQPLTAIRSNTYLVEQYIEKSRLPEAKEKLFRINQITDRATNLCQHLKSFARKTDDVTQPTHVITVLKNALDLFSGTLPEHWVDIDVPDNLYVSANDIRLEQVFVNLLSNCIDAIASRQQTETFSPQINIRIGSTTTYQAIHISDNGCGMDASSHSQVFEPFFTTKDVGDGLGLGMSITHNIIQDFGGSITIQSKLGQGTEVILCLKPV